MRAFPGRKRHMEPVTARHRRRLLHVTHFAAGGVCYGGLEIAWRGFTHVSMLLTSGVCVLLLFRLAASSRPLPLLCAAGMAGITGMEFAVGCVVNLWLGLDVWDYSDMRFQLGGQVCAAYTMVWFGMSAVMLPVCRRILRLEHRFLREDSAQALPAGTEQA